MNGQYTHASTGFHKIGYKIFKDKNHEAYIHKSIKDHVHQWEEIDKDELLNIMESLSYFGC